MMPIGPTAAFATPGGLRAAAARVATRPACCPRQRVRACSPAPATAANARQPAAVPAPATSLKTPAAPPPSHVITILSGRANASPAALASVAAAAVARANGRVDAVRELGTHAHQMLAALPNPAGLASLRAELFEEGARVQADLNIHSGNLWSGPKRLAVFDLDSTLILQETIDELAEEIGVAPQVREITRRAMSGELNFRDALTERVALLKGLHIDRFETVKSRVQFTPGARELTLVLRKMNVEMAVISGGFEFLAHHVRDELNLDHAFANQLQVGPDNRLTGRTEGEIVDGEFKATTLRRLADARGLGQDEVIAIGDGSNDIPMMKLAGLGIAFNAKPLVQRSAGARVNQDSLASVLYILGLSDADIASYTS